jgi:hypothetical protein
VNPDLGIFHRRRRWSSLTVALLLSSAGLASADPETASRYDAQRVGWARLEFAASKLWLSAQASIATTPRHHGEIAGRLIPSGTGQPVPAPEQIVELTYNASGVGRQSATTLWLDGATGAAIQRIQVDTGNRQRHRIYRFTDMGAWHRTERPANSRESKLPAEQWTDRSEGFRPYPPEAKGLIITEPAALLWLISAAELTRSGDQMELFTFSRRQVHRVSIRVAGTKVARVDYRESTGTGARQRRGEVEVLQLLIRGQPLHEQADEDDEFELLGLQGDIELLLEPTARAPLALSGRAKIVGQVVFRLRKAALR